MKLSAKYWCSGLMVVGVVAALLGSTMVFADNINSGVLAINGQVGGLTYGQKNIMFPLFNVEWSVAEAQANGNACIVPASPSGTSDAALQACATAQANHATAPGAELEAEVDGKTLQSLTNYRAVSPPFDFTSAPGNPLGVCQPTGCNSHAVADGFWIILDPPLGPGKHTIPFVAHVPFPELNFTFKTETTYQLTVLAG
jgi:hypothetical protein